MALSDDILPMPGTKVTTTVRTYTYEIPANSPTDVNTNRTLLYKNNNYNTIQRNEINQLINQQSPPPITTNTTPKTVVYNTESYSTVNRNEEIPIVTNYTKEIRDNIETNIIRNDLPPPQQQHRSPTGGHPGSTNKTYIYKVNTTENVHSSQEPPYYRNTPQNVNYSPQNSNYPSPQNLNYPPHGPTTNRYYYHESNVTNTTHGPGGPIGPGSPGGPNYVPNEPMGSPQKLTAISYPPHDRYPPQSPPNNPTIIHKYSVTNTTNTRHGPDYGPSSSVQQPAPFPVDGISYPVANGNPPQRVDDLMQSFGNVCIV